MHRSPQELARARHRQRPAYARRTALEAGATHPTTEMVRVDSRSIQSDRAHHCNRPPRQARRRRHPCPMSPLHPGPILTGAEQAMLAARTLYRHESAELHEQLHRAPRRKGRSQLQPMRQGARRAGHTTSDSPACICPQRTCIRWGLCGRTSMDTCHPSCPARR